MAIKFTEPEKLPISAKRTIVRARRETKAATEKYGSASDLIERQREINAAPEEKIRAAAGTFDRNAYQRELMRKRRAEDRRKKEQGKDG